MARWKIHLEKEVNETVTKIDDSDVKEETDSLDLKTAQARLDALRKDAHEAFQDDAPAKPDAPTGDAPPAEDTNQP